MNCIVEPGGKQIYLVCVPPPADLVEDPLVERPFRLDNLVVTGSHSTCLE